MHLPVGLLARLRQGLNEIVPVNIVQEDALAAIASAMEVDECLRDDATPPSESGIKRATISPASAMSWS